MSTAVTLPPEIRGGRATGLDDIVQLDRQHGAEVFGELAAMFANHLEDALARTIGRCDPIVRRLDLKIPEPLTALGIQQTSGDACVHFGRVFELVCTRENAKQHNDVDRRTGYALGDINHFGIAPARTCLREIIERDRNLVEHIETFGMEFAGDGI